MGQFTYAAVREPDTVIEGEIEAEDTCAAAAALVGRGYHVLHIASAEDGSRGGLSIGYGVLGGLRRRDLTCFMRDLAGLRRAGLLLAVALEKMASRKELKTWRSLTTGLRARLEDGYTFSQALAEFPRVFNPM